MARRFAADELQALVSQREVLVRAHPIVLDACSSRHLCSCGKRFSTAHAAEVWGAAAEPEDRVLHRQAHQAVVKQDPALTCSVREALADKEYRQRGGTFAFSTHLDTFIHGLHRRTRDLHEFWRQSGLRTAGVAACDAGVGELLLRLRWDDRDSRARVKLSRIIARLWRSLEGAEEGADGSLSSALWLED